MNIRAGKRRRAFLAGLLLSSLGIAARIPLRSPPGHPLPGTDWLTVQDKAQLKEYLRLKKAFGERSWPGFAPAEIPIILAGEKADFLLFHPNPGPSWTRVEADTFEGIPYHSRVAGASQAFAEKVGDLWAGSLDTLDEMNRAMEDQVRERLPVEKITPVFLKMMEITPAWHIVALLHEAFHAYQAMERPGRFERARRVYAAEGDYPFDDVTFRESWNEEGGVLASAFLNRIATEKSALVRRFLELRSRRRTSASLSPGLIGFERDLEWLEGSAKYVELRFADLGAAASGQETAKDYLITRNRLRMDFITRLRKLGELSGDGRFYLSGAAAGFLLDEIRPGWKTEIWADDNLALEDLLRASLEKD